MHKVLEAERVERAEQAEQVALRGAQARQELRAGQSAPVVLRPLLRRRRIRERAQGPVNESTLRLEVSRDPPSIRHCQEHSRVKEHPVRQAP